MTLLRCLAGGALIKNERESASRLHDMICLTKLIKFLFPPLLTTPAISFGFERVIRYLVEILRIWRHPTPIV